MKMSNIGNSLANVCDNLSRKCLSFFVTLLMKVNMTIRGVEYGRHLRFYGFAKFKRANKGLINVGSHCIFNSSHTSNLIGVNRPCLFSALLPDSRLVIGHHCGFSGTVIGCFVRITLGNHVKCGANTLITDSDWHLEDARTGKPQPIVIEDNVWLGVNVTVLKGVRIGANSVIGAHSLVVKDIPANVIAAGNPCKVIKAL
ncbi:acyltransferase [Geofilum rubicundum]|uniref:acyltransferase n=1 Tax=Geofilum rubicundum TaxID=472113 RepID=UPI00138DE1DB|nr:acyltransferase [Geofilum rubicundum]